MPNIIHICGVWSATAATTGGVIFSASSDGQFFRLRVLIGDLQVADERVEIEYRDADLLPDGIDADFESWPLTGTKTLVIAAI